MKIENKKIVLIGCKSDLADEREISDIEIKSLEEIYKVPCYLTSSKSNSNVKESLDNFALS